MPKRSKVLGLPQEVRAYLDKILLEQNFSGYEALEAELAKLGHAIGKSSIHRYGANLQRKLEAIKASTDAAAAIAAAAPDDADLRSAATMSMLQTDIFGVLVNIQEAAADDDPAKRLKLLSNAASSIAKLSRASVNQKKWETEVRAKLRSAADAVAKAAKRGGLSKGAVDEIRREILGIANQG